MTQASNTSSGGSLGFVGALTILFVALKLTNVINWSWLWVLAPIWISWGLVLIIILIAAGVFVALEAKKPRVTIKNYSRSIK